MKKKKFILPVFLFILSLIFCGGITQYSTVSVKAATTTKKQTGFVMKNGSWYYYDKNGIAYDPEKFQIHDCEHCHDE